MEKLIEKINKLKKEKKAVLLVHNYQISEVQDIADFVGDSLELSRKASSTDAEVIVFCGVHFMAETAKIINPDKIVLLPDDTAGCPMAEMITSHHVRELKRKYSNSEVVCYVNSSADVKAESDICCTSANSVQIVASLDENKEIIFIPDKYLGQFTARYFPNRRFHLWDGYCPTHFKITMEDIEQAKNLHPSAKVMVHPECREEVVDLADAVVSTSGMLKYAKENNADEFIVGTEIGILYRLKKDNPDKKFYAASERAVCLNMKKNNLEKVLWTLEEMKPEITVPEDIRVRAKRAVDRMLSVTAKSAEVKKD